MTARHAVCPGCGYTQPRHKDGSFIAHQGYNGAPCSGKAAS